jgi:hypothetical protein
MEFEINPHTKIIVNLEVGENVTIKKQLVRLLGAKILDRPCKIERIKKQLYGCESGVLIKLKGYSDFIDSGWIKKIKPTTKVKQQ